MESTERLELETETPVLQPTRKSQITKQLLGILIAAVFLYFAFKNADWNKIIDCARSLDPGWVAVLFGAGVTSHLARAARWVILLEPLADHRISLWNSFCAVIYGYAVNIVLPRGGEIARLVSISKLERISWAGVLPTMLIDRLLDVAMLVGLLGLSISLLPTSEMGMPWLLPSGLAMCAAVVAGLLALPFVGRISRMITSLEPIKQVVPNRIIQKINDLSTQFDLGTKSLTNPAKLPVVALLSFTIWFLYWLELYLMVLASHLTKVVSAVQSLHIFTIGSVGVLVPTPGSVGSYHLLVSKALSQIAGVDSNQALAFATVLHFLCFILLSCIPAALCFILQSPGKKAT